MDITLALGGGGSKGNAHIGVIRRLEKEGFRVRGVAGTSFGGLIAVLYALGYSPDEIEEYFASLDQTQFYGRAPNDGPSLMGLAGVTRLLEERIGDITFDDLKLPCVLTAVDLKSGNEVLLRKGRVIDAMLATIAIPGIFPVRYIGDLELVDGGTLDPVPVAPARMLAPRLPVVAVVLTMPMDVPPQTWRLPFQRYWIGRVVSRVLTRMRYDSIWDIFTRSLDITARAVTQYRLEMDHPEVILRPEVYDIDTLDLVDVHEIAKRGEQAVDAALPQLRNLFTWRNRWRRSIGVYHQRRIYN
ncbi:MAG TPA: patatin-like phospholipase family protein [Anaerolineales bacterium]|jgi:NTE family protein|nr:patatin-like phospholipase family protein [Anaerolineales bacterium]